MFANLPQSRRKRAALLALKVAGATCWAYAYREAIDISRRTGRGPLPDPAIAFNLAWEAIYTAGGIWKWRELELEDRVQTVINAIWLSYDIRFASSLPRKDRQTFRLMLVAVLYQLLFLAKYPPGKAARISALWQNLGFSGYCALSVNQKFPADVSTAKFTLLRAIGTAVPTFTSGVMRGIEPAYLLPGIGCIAFDLLRIGREQSRPKKS
ncbi:hypothetical protein ACIQAR_22605 [Micromonospora chalcea]